ncbi:hypothetical protein B0T09DRAFT_335906, partial [Sordaria sp. MPI-SDFR-AT-0083]
MFWIFYELFLDGQDIHRFSLLLVFFLFFPFASYTYSLLLLILYSVSPYGFLTSSIGLLSSIVSSSSRPLKRRPIYIYRHDCYDQSRAPMIPLFLSYFLFAFASLIFLQHIAFRYHPFSLPKKHTLFRYD